MDDNLVLFRIDGQDNALPRDVTAAAIIYPAAIIAVALRFWARRLSQARLWWDDWLILPSLFVDTLGTGLAIAWWVNGGGRYIGAVTPKKLRTIFALIFIIEIVYAVGMLFTRLSVLMLWQRLFPQKWTRRYCQFWMLLAGLWTISIITVSCLQCQPTWGFWERFKPGVECKVDVKEQFKYFAISGIIIDLAILALPLVRCWRLNLSLTNKLLVTGIFATGLFATIISAVRIRAVVNANLESLQAVNATWTFDDTGTWSLVEVNVATVSACLPMLRPVLAKLVPTAWVPDSLRRRSFTPYSVRMSLVRGNSRGDAAIVATVTDTIGTTVAAENDHSATASQIQKSRIDLAVHEKAASAATYSAPALSRGDTMAAAAATESIVEVVGSPVASRIRNGSKYNLVNNELYGSSTYVASAQRHSQNENFIWIERSVRVHSERASLESHV